MGRSCVGSLMILLALASVATADEDRDRRARAALALTAPAVQTAAPCTCPAGTRGEWAGQAMKSMKDNRVVVLFSNGVEPRCCKGTLVATRPTLPVGQDKAKPIIVYVPVDGNRLQVVAELPADASNAVITRAVNKAKVLTGELPK